MSGPNHNSKWYALLFAGCLSVTLPSNSAAAVALNCTPKPDAEPFLDTTLTEQGRPTLSLPLETDHLVEGSANKMSASEERLTMQGDVYIRQQDWQVWADQLEHHFDSSITRLDGNVRLINPSLILQGDTATIAQNRNAYTVSKPRFRYAQEGGTVFRGEAEQAHYEDDIVTAKKGWISTCPADDRSWSIRASTVSFDQKRKRGTAKNLVFRIGRLPIFYLPWFQFPTTNERQSGMLSPDFQLQGDGNPDLALPIYLNLAPNYDAIITPRLIFGRGLLTRADFRLLTRSMRNEFGGALMFNDRHALPELLGNKPNRWYVNWDHQGYWGNGFNTRIDYTQTSDRLYYRDFGNDQEVISLGELRQAAIAGFHRQDWSMSLLVQRFQILDFGVNTPYTLLPGFDFNWQPLRASRLKWQLQAGLDLFDRNALADPNTQQVTGRRLRATPRLIFETGRSYGGLRMDAAWRVRQYDLKGEGGNRRTISSGLFTVDAHLKLVRYMNNTAHFLEPRIRYLWSEYVDQSSLPIFDSTTRPGKIRDLFVENRFTGYDRIQDGNRFLIGVSNRWQSLISGHEWANLNIAGLFRVKPERVALSGVAGGAAAKTFGTLLIELGVKPTPNLSLSSAWTTQPETGKTTKLTFKVGYHNGDRKILNLEYRDRQQRKRIRGSFYWPISKTLQLAGVWNRDIQTNTNLERIFGIEYFHCCLQVRIGWRSFPVGLDPTGRSLFDKGVFFQISLKGLGRVRSSASNIYQSSIQGFREPNIWGTDANDIQP